MSRPPKRLYHRPDLDASLRLFAYGKSEKKGTVYSALSTAQKGIRKSDY